jgi:PST family polysaccharide transporter
VSLARSALGGVAWNWAGSVVLIVAQILSTAATARLISPREFGAYATAQALAGLVGYFTMTALGSGLLRRSKLEPRVVGSALTLSLGTSALIALVVWFSAAPWANAWRVPEAIGLIRILAVTLLLTSAATVPLALIRRELRFGTAAIVETGTQVLGLGISVALAFDLHSATALAVGQAVAGGTLLAASAVIARRRLTLRFDRCEARELLTFSGQVSLLSLSSYIAFTVPGWFAARVYGASVLGLYSRAALIVGLPVTYLTTGVTKVFYPLYGRVRDDAVRTRTLLADGLILTTGLTWPLFALVAGASPAVVKILLGDKWHAAAPLVALCALGACASLPCSLLTNVAEAFGWMRLIATRQLGLCGGIGATIVVVKLGGLDIEWLLAGVAAAQWIAYILTVVPFVKRDFLDGRSVALTQSIHGGYSLVAFGLAFGCARALEGSVPAIQVTGQLAVAGAVAGLILLGGGWFPAKRTLARRIGPPEPGDAVLVRIGAAVLR